eukprot:TRINITY_DN7550_c0_g1_i1.p1 TRINITY_DN7550_c0_g1~~TRINITY_DN7550_c0_g1_i1.p1  ORF type:complete len:565 (-),score=91.67 TRINITY_DN7550_c0_g1_i1:289-1944(-)
MMSKACAPQLIAIGAAGTCAALVRGLMIWKKRTPGARGKPLHDECKGTTASPAIPAGARAEHSDDECEGTTASPVLPVLLGSSTASSVEAKAQLPSPVGRRERRLSEREWYAVSPMTVVNEPVVIAMVGLPARGKSYISKAIVRYLNFLGCPARLFNAGNKRRDQGLAGTSAAFFDSSNADAKLQREQIAMETLDDLLAWLHSFQDGCACGIFDATNTTQERRRAVIERCASAPSPVRLIFVESICNDLEILDKNYRMKLENEDYKTADATSALQDFKDRVRAYEDVYEPLSDEEGRNSPGLRYVQIIDAGRKLVTVECHGYVISHLLPLLHSISLSPRKLSIVVAGESENDCNGFRGGDTFLSPAGLQYSLAVSRVILQREDKPARILTGTMRRYSQLSDMLCGGSRLIVKYKSLDELCFGSLEGLPGGRLRHSFPKEFARRQADKLRYRYPGAGGESYMDLIMRLREVILSIEECSSDAIVICDVAVARTLLGYFRGIPIAEIPDVRVCPGIIELTRSHSGFVYSHVPIDQGSASLLAKSTTSDRFLTG